MTFVNKRSSMQGRVDKFGGERSASGWDARLSRNNLLSDGRNDSSCVKTDFFWNVRFLKKMCRIPA